MLFLRRLLPAILFGWRLILSQVNHAPAHYYAPAILAELVAGVVKRAEEPRGYLAGGDAVPLVVCSNHEDCTARSEGEANLVAPSAMALFRRRKALARRTSRHLFPRVRERTKKTQWLRQWLYGWLRALSESWEIGLL